MERSFSKNKDVDREILQRLDDRDLFQTLLTSKYSYEITNNDNFWRNRLLMKYASTISHKPEDVSWKDYYLSAVYYIEELKRKGFEFKYGDPKFLHKLLVLQRGKRQIYYILDELVENGYLDIALNIFNGFRKSFNSKLLTLEEFIQYIQLQPGKKLAY